MRNAALVLVAALVATACGRGPAPAVPGPGRPTGTKVVTHPAGVRFEAPAAWTCAPEGRAVKVTPGGGLTVECAVEILAGLALPDAPGEQSGKAMDALFLARSMAFERVEPVVADAGRPDMAEYSYSVPLDGRPVLRARAVLRVTADRPALVATMIGPGDQIEELTPAFRALLQTAEFTE